MATRDKTGKNLWTVSSRGARVAGVQGTEQGCPQTQGQSTGNGREGSEDSGTSAGKWGHGEAGARGRSLPTASTF